MEVFMVKRLVVLLSLIFLCSGAASAAEFSADMISTTKSGRTNTGKAFFSKDKWRIDMGAPQKGSERAFATTSIITRSDKKVIWTIMPARKMYGEKAYDDMKDRPYVGQKMLGEVARNEFKDISAVTCAQKSATISICHNCVVFPVT
jgi:hypothetical protein